MSDPDYTSLPPASTGSTVTTAPSPGGPIGGLGELPHSGITTLGDVLWLVAILVVVGVIVTVAARRARGD